MAAKGLEYLFVYGILRHHRKNPIHWVLANGARYIGPGSFQGRVQDVGGYPGATTSDDPLEQVQGDVYVLIDRRSLLPVLDCFEGCVPGTREVPEFKRRKRNVRLANGQTVNAWVYLYNWADRNRGQPGQGKTCLTASDWSGTQIPPS